MGAAGWIILALLAKAVMGGRKQLTALGEPEAERQAWENLEAGVINEFGQVVKLVPGLTNDEADGMPIGVYGEDVNAYQDRAMAWSQETGQPVPLPF